MLCSLFLFPSKNTLSNPSWANLAFSNCPHLHLMRNTRTNRCMSKKCHLSTLQQSGRKFVTSMAAWLNPTATTSNVQDTNSIIEENHKESLMFSLHRLRHWRSLSSLVIIDKCISEFRGLGAMCVQKTQDHSNLKERCVSLKYKIGGLASLWVLNLSSQHYHSSQELRSS